MFRYCVQSVDPQPPARLILPGASSSSPVEVRFGDVVLLRQRSFKFETLVPVVPTKFILVILPIATTVTAPPSAGGLTAAGSSSHLLSEDLRAMAHIVDAVRSAIPGGAVDVHDAVVDVARKQAVIVLNLHTSDHLVEALDVCDGWPANYFLESAQTRRRLMAFGCDARDADEVGGLTVISETYFELPSCLLCCDRLLRTISGLVGRVCDCPDDECTCHAASTCPACRTSWQRDMGCSECGSTDDSWVCLICGYVGCSRYRNMHVRAHCTAHMHDFSMSLTTQQVWDYLSDRFVHRLIVSLNSSTGTSERMHFPESSDLATTAAAEPSKTASTFGGEVKGSKMLVDAKLDAKIEQYCTEYTRMLQTNLAAQRSHYEALLRRQSTTRSMPATPADSDETKTARDVSISSSLQWDSAAVSTALHVMHDLEHQYADVQRAVALATQASNASQERQVQLKEAYRQHVERATATQEKLEAQIRELQDTIAEVKLNFVTQQRLAGAAQGEGGLSGAMALLSGGGSSSKKRSAGGSQAQSSRRK